MAAYRKDADPASHWNTTKYEVMRHVLMAKSGVTSYNMTIHYSFWGSGLSYILTITTPPEKYPGKNMLGKLLCEIRSLSKKRYTVRSGQAPEAGYFEAEIAYDGGAQPLTSSTNPTSTSEM